MSRKSFDLDRDLPSLDLQRVRDAVMGFHGDARQLESAIGAWVLGCLIGGRGLELVHSRASLERYARILGFERWADLLAILPGSGPKTGDMALLKVRRRFESVVSALRVGGVREVRPSVK